MARVSGEGSAAASSVDNRAVVFSCVSENLPAWHVRVLNLIFSVRALGGACRGARFVASFVGGVDPDVKARLEGLGAEVRTVPEMAGTSGHGNKLRMLEVEAGQAEVLVGLDCDIVVVGDPSEWIRRDRIGVKSVDIDAFSDGDWRRLYGAMGLSDPGRVSITTSTGKPTRPCFNSGVVTVPMELCQPLRRQWEAAHARLTRALTLAPELIPAYLHMFAEQLSLGFAIAEAGLDWGLLPVEMNFPTHLNVDPAARGDRHLSILHYHSKIDARGFLLRPKTPVAAEAADRFNRMRSDSLGIPYHGFPSRSASRGAASLARRARGFAQIRRHRLGASLGRLRRRRPLRSSP